MGVVRVRGRQLPLLAVGRVQRGEVHPVARSAALVHRLLHGRERARPAVPAHRELPLLGLVGVHRVVDGRVKRQLVDAVRHGLAVLVHPDGELVAVAIRRGHAGLDRGVEVIPHVRRRAGQRRRERRRRGGRGRVEDLKRQDPLRRRAVARHGPQQRVARGAGLGGDEERARGEAPRGDVGAAARGDHHHGLARRLADVDAVAGEHVHLAALRHELDEVVGEGVDEPQAVELADGHRQRRQRLAVGVHVHERRVVERRARGVDAEVGREGRLCLLLLFLLVAGSAAGWRSRGVGPLRGVEGTQGPRGRRGMGMEIRVVLVLQRVDDAVEGDMTARAVRGSAILGISGTFYLGRMYRVLYSTLYFI